MLVLCLSSLLIHLGSSQSTFVVNLEVHSALSLVKESHYINLVPLFNGGSPQFLHQLLQEQVNHGSSSFASICMKTTGWCQLHNNEKECSKQYLDSTPQCKKIIAVPPSYQLPLFGIHIQGTISVQFSLRTVDGFLLAVSDVQQYTSLTDSDVEALTEDQYFTKFQREEQKAPFGETYYGIFAELIKQVFVQRNVPSGSPLPFVSSSLSTSTTLSDSDALPLTVVEIGIARAGHSSNILKELLPEHVESLLGVDPYLAMYDEHDLFAVKKQVEFDAMHTWIQLRLEKEERARGYEQSRFTSLRMMSVQAAEMLSAKQTVIHAVFVDGDHRPAAVLEDLNAWYKVLIPGGLIAGDDYHLEGVRQGVDLFFQNFKINFPLLTTPTLQMASMVDDYVLFAFTKPVETQARTFFGTT